MINEGQHCFQNDTDTVDTVIVIPLPKHFEDKCRENIFFFSSVFFTKCDYFEAHAYAMIFDAIQNSIRCRISLSYNSLYASFASRSLRYGLMCSFSM